MNQIFESSHGQKHSEVPHKNKQVKPTKLFRSEREGLKMGGSCDLNLLIKFRRHPSPTTLHKMNNLKQTMSKGTSLHKSHFQRRRSTSSTPVNERPFHQRRRSTTGAPMNDATNNFMQLKTSISEESQSRRSNSVRQTRYRHTIACPNSPRIEESKEFFRQHSPKQLQQRGRFLVWPTAITVEDTKMPSIRGY